MDGLETLAAGLSVLAESEVSFGGLEALRDRDELVVLAEQDGTALELVERLGGNGTLEHHHVGSVEGVLLLLLGLLAELWLSLKEGGSGLSVLLFTPIALFADDIAGPGIFVDDRQLAVEGGLVFALLEEISWRLEVTMQVRVSEESTDGGERLTGVKLGRGLVGANNEPLVLILEENKTGSLRLMSTRTFVTVVPPLVAADGFLGNTKSVCSRLLDFNPLACVILDVTGIPEELLLVGVNTFVFDDILIGLV